MSNSLDPDQARHAVGPDLGPNCLQKVISRGHSVGNDLPLQSTLTNLNMDIACSGNSVDPDQLASVYHIDFLGPKHIQG